MGRSSGFCTKHFIMKSCASSLSPEEGRSRSFAEGSFPDVQTFFHILLGKRPKSRTKETIPMDQRSTAAPYENRCDGVFFTDDWVEEMDDLNVDELIITPP